MARSAAPSDAQIRLVRLCELLLLLSRSKMGITVDEIKDSLGVARRTAYRYLAVLQDAGVPIDVKEGRYHFLNATELPPLGLNALQVASLRLARLQLAPLAGTRLLRELDRFLAELDPRSKRKKSTQTSFEFAAPLRPLAAPKVVRAIEKAVASRRRVHIEYRAASRGGATTRVHIEPLVVNVAEADPYVLAFCVERNEERTYKLSRIQSAQLTNERVARRRLSMSGKPFDGAVKAWSGAASIIEVRLDANVAWLAREYPLPEQSEHPNADGTVTIRAKVAGLVEVRPRILAWGATAEVLKPEELREAVRAELAGALRKYDGPGPAKAGPRKSGGGARGADTQVGTRGV